MKLFDWSDEKNSWLLAERNVTIEEAVYWIMHGGLLDILEYPNTQKHPNQKVFIVNIDNYACLMPFVKDGDAIYLKTIIPSRNMDGRGRSAC